VTCLGSSFFKYSLNERIQVTVDKVHTSFSEGQVTVGNFACEKDFNFISFNIAGTLIMLTTTPTAHFTSDNMSELAKEHILSNQNEEELAASTNNIVQ